MEKEKKVKKEKPVKAKVAKKPEITASLLARWAAAEEVPVHGLILYLEHKGEKVSAKAMKTVYYKTKRGKLKAGELPTKEASNAVKVQINKLLAAENKERQASKDAKAEAKAAEKKKAKAKAA